uniref:DUF629 domain-containing protein n=1 Tax=Oryza brachyantha TaxID=4533 RepID=J3N9G3_ORYBR
MRSHKEGKHYKEAILRAGELAAKHGGSALVLNLVGELQKAMHRDSALVSFAAAAKLAPNCIDTAVSHASMLFESERYVEAQVELLRALAISDPVDPAEHNVGYGLCSDLTSAERLRDARARARNAMESFTTFICEEFVPTESIRVLDAIKLGREVAATAYDLAKGLATSFQFSGRAQFLRAYVYLKRVRGFDPAIDKRPFLRRTSRMLQDSVIAFRRSLVIALFHAKLLFVLGEYADAERACHRALAIESPDDPKEHDLPPGSVSGEEYDDRVSCVKNQLRTLIKKIIFVGASYSRLPSYEKEDSLMSVKVKPLLELCNATDKSLAKTITDALRFFKKNNSWSFWICPLSARCDGREFVDTPSLWKHLCSKHPERLWGKLESILGPKLCESERDCFALEWITFSQDQDQHDIFRLVKMDGMFDSLIRRAYVGAEPNLVEMRTDKCREGAEILEGIKRRLGALPADISSSQFDDARSGIQNMWLNFLKISVLDYREFMYPVAKLKKGMTDNPNIVGHISDSKIDSIFDDAPSAYGCNVSEGHDSDPSDANKMGTTRKQNLKPLHSNRTLKADGDHQESELCFEDGNSMVKPPNDTEGKEMEIDEIVANVERNELELLVANLLRKWQTQTAIEVSLLSTKKPLTKTCLSIK